MTLNRTQKIIIGIGTAVILLAALFPPWHTTLGHYESYAFQFFTNPPRKYSCTINQGLLLIRLGVIVLVTTGLLLVAARRKIERT